MGFAGTFRWIRVGNAQAQGTGLSQLPKPVEFLKLTVIRADKCRCEIDPTLGGSLVAANGCEVTAITDSWHSLCIENRAVGKSVDAIRELLADAVCNIVSARDDKIGTQ